MYRRIRRPAVLGTITAAAAALSLAAAVPARAGAIGDPGFSAATGGYQVSSPISGQAFNDVRATVTFPFISDARSQASLLLQSATGSGATAELTFVFDGENEWTLQWGFSPTAAAPSMSAVIPLISVTTSPFYLEIHYSTQGHELVFLGGSESHPAVLARVTGVRATFGAPGAEVTSVAQPAATLGGGVQATFTRVGVTELVSPANPASPTQRLPFAAEPLHETIATASGLIPGPGNKETLIPSPLGAGSEFRVSSSL